VSEVFEVDAPDELPLNAAEEALAAGEAVVFPTDTVYGLAGRPDIPGATDRLFEMKQRPRDLTLPLLAAGPEDASGVAVFDDRAWALSGPFWPGGLTMVLPRTSRALAWDLGAEAETVGVRVPDHAVARALLARTGPLAVTSANRSGDPTPSTCSGVRESLGELVAVYLCSGEASGIVPSTVVDLTGAETRVLREGSVGPDAILDVLRGAM
jgi:tRNA threonylcarbamoyl adenosine modification protein (Sua5/YciO/YrdC/YwlC family)